MAVWNFTNNATSLGFTTSGMTSAVKIRAMSGPVGFYMPRVYEQSYYANGSFNVGFGATRGLINTCNMGSVNSTQTAKTRVIDNTTNIRLSTQGVSGTFSAQFAYPENFYIYNSALQFPNYTTITVGIYNGIIYRWNETQTSWPGVGVVDNLNSLRIVAGLSGTVSFLTIYDVYMYSPQYDSYNILRRLDAVRIFYTSTSITFLNGLIQSMTWNDNTLWRYNVY